jgi:hypothetical protein
VLIKETTVTRIVQIATGHETVKANYAGEAALTVLIWALVEDEGTTELVGMVMNPDTMQVVRANEIDGFRGYAS